MEEMQETKHILALHPNDSNRAISYARFLCFYMNGLISIKRNMVPSNWALRMLMYPSAVLNGTRGFTVLKALDSATVGKDV